MMQKTIFIVIIVLCASLESFALEQEKDALLYESKGKRDPFIPLIIQKGRAVPTLEDALTVDDVILEGILWDAGGGSIAVLNGTVVSEGEKIGNIIIKDIKQKYVVIIIDGVEHKVELLKKAGG